MAGHLNVLAVAAVIAVWYCRYLPTLMNDLNGMEYTGYLHST